VIPYYPQPVFALGPLRIHAFSIMMAAAILVLRAMVVRRARRFGIPSEEMVPFCLSLLLAGIGGAFAGSMVLSGRPGLASSGAVVEVLVAAFLYHVVRRIAWTRLVFAFGRARIRESIRRRFGTARLHARSRSSRPALGGLAGCAIPGRAALRSRTHRFLFFLTALSVTFFLLDRKSHAPGFFFGLAALAYGLSACGAKHWTYRRTSFRG
jgi:prolipoprotein diacylglyceryltransferase